MSAGHCTGKDMAGEVQEGQGDESDNPLATDLEYPIDEHRGEGGGQVWVRVQGIAGDFCESHDAALLHAPQIGHKTLESGY